VLRERRPEAYPTALAAHDNRRSRAVGHFEPDASWLRAAPRPRRATDETDPRQRPRGWRGRATLARPSGASGTATGRGVARHRRQKREAMTPGPHPGRRGRAESEPDPGDAGDDRRVRAGRDSEQSVLGRLEGRSRW